MLFGLRRVTTLGGAGGGLSPPFKGGWKALVRLSARLMVIFLSVDSIRLLARLGPTPKKLVY